MDQNPNQSQPDPDTQNSSERLGPPAGGPQYSPPYGPPAGGPQYPPPYGPPAGGPPYPAGYPQAQPPKKGSKLWLWILLAIIGVSLIACIVSCTVASSAFVPLLNSSIKNAEATSTARAIPDNNNNNDFSSANVQTVSVGNPVTIGDVSCTLTSVTSNSGDSTVTPQTGDEFVVVNIKLTNNSKQSQEYSTFNFYVVNSGGKATLNSNVVPKADGQQLAEGNLAPGQSVVGKLVFEVVRSDHDQTFNWQPDLNANPQDAHIGAWSLKL